MTLSNIKEKYKYFYEKIVKKPLDITQPSNILLKELFLGITLKYLKTGIIYNNIKLYSDDNIIYTYIERFSKDNIKYLYTKNNYEFVIIKSNIQKIYILLFETYANFYDNKIIEVNKVVEKQILIKLLILKKYYKELYNTIFTNIIKIFIEYNPTNDYLKELITQNSDDIFRYLYETKKNIFDNNIIIYTDDANEFNFIKLYILKTFFKNSYSLLLEYFSVTYSNYIDKYIIKYSKLSHILLLNIYNKYQIDDYKELIESKIDILYDIVFIKFKSNYDKLIFDIKTNKFKQLLIKLIVLYECFDIKFNKINESSKSSKSSKSSNTDKSLAELAR